MRHHALKNFLLFLLVLVLTVGTVATLSVVTQAKTRAASAQSAAVVQELSEKEETTPTLAVSTPQAGTDNLLLSIGAFLLLLLIPAGGILLFLAARSKGKENGRSRRRYCPRADMAFQNTSKFRV